jgi:hypothetical protein
MDASTVYGSTPVTSTSLRNFTNGLLKTTKDVLSATTGRDLLPITTPCTIGACFFAGINVIDRLITHLCKPFVCMTR